MVKNIDFGRIKRLTQAGFFHIFVGNSICKVISFLTTMILARVLSKNEYGIFTYTWNIYGIVMLASGLGIEAALYQFASEHNSDEKYVKTLYAYGAKKALVINFVLGLILLSVAFLVPFKIEQARNTLARLCLLPCVQILYSLSTIYLRSLKKYRFFSYASILNSFFVLAFGIFGALYFREVGLLFGYYVAYALSFFICLWVFRVRLFSPAASSFSKQDRSDLWKFALVSMSSDAMSQLLYLLDIFMLGLIIADETVLASYHIATQIPTALTFIPASLVVFIYPYFAEHKDDGNWCLRTYKTIIFWFGLFNIFVSVILFVCAPWIIEMFYGADYADSVLIFRILALNYSISGTFRILSGNLLASQRKLKFNFFMTMASSIINIAADYFFIQKWGSLGAAMTTVTVVAFSSFMSTVYLVYVFKNGHKNSNNGKGSKK